MPDRYQLVRPTTHLSCVELDRRQCANNKSGSTIVDRTVKFCRTHTHFYIVRKSTHVKRWTQSTTNFWLFTDKLGRSWLKLSSRYSADEVELLLLLQTPTFAAFVVVSTTARPPSSSTDDTVYNYALPSTPTCRWLWGSVNPSSSTFCRWPPGSDNVPSSSTHQRRHGLLTPRRDPSLRQLYRIYSYIHLPSAYCQRRASHAIGYFFCQYLSLLCIRVNKYSSLNCQYNYV